MPLDCVGLSRNPKYHSTACNPEIIRIMLRCLSINWHVCEHLERYDLTFSTPIELPPAAFFWTIEKPVEGAATTTLQQLSERSRCSQTCQFVDSHRNKMRIMSGLHAVLWNFRFLDKPTQSSGIISAAVFRAVTSLGSCKSAHYFKTTFFRAYRKRRESSVNSYCIKIWLALDK